MKPMLFPISVALFVLAGCAPLTSTEYVSTASAVNRVDWKENYQTVYRKVVQQSERCFEPGAIAGYRIDRDIFPDIEEGKVTVMMVGPGMRPAIQFVATIKPSPLPNETVVMVYTHFSDGKRIATWLEDLSKGSTDCY